MVVIGGGGVVAVVRVWPRAGEFEDGELRDAGCRSAHLSIAASGATVAQSLGDKV